MPLLKIRVFWPPITSHLMKLLFQLRFLQSRQSSWTCIIMQQEKKSSVMRCVLHLLQVLHKCKQISRIGDVSGFNSWNSETCIHCKNTIHSGYWLDHHISHCPRPHQCEGSNEVRIKSSPSLPFHRCRLPVPVSLTNSRTQPRQPSRGKLKYLQFHHEHVLALTVKLSLCLPWRHTGKHNWSSSNSLTSTLNGDKWSTSRPSHCIIEKEKRHPLNITVGGLRTSLNDVEDRKTSDSCRDSNSSSSSPLPTTLSRLL